MAVSTRPIGRSTLLKNIKGRQTIYYQTYVRRKEYKREMKK